ncbi:MAG TPA: hypothetical protein VMU83_04020 [Hanamia sp.]|nr:hypothetical protein [Hanamia sp.]
MYEKILFLFLVLASTTFSYAQTSPDYSQIKLDNPDDYRAANTFALMAANTLLSNPVDKNKIDRLNCQKFLLKWMSGTPDYGFTFGNSEKILTNNPDLMTLYIASMVKFRLENKVENTDQEKIKLESWKILLAYCDTPANDVRLTNKLKKLIEANKNGELEKDL